MHRGPTGRNHQGAGYAESRADPDDERELARVELPGDQAVLLESGVQEGHGVAAGQEGLEGDHF